MQKNILDELNARGLIADCSDARSLDVCLKAGPISAYCGFDPTADSLHVGSLQSLLVLRLFQRYGHCPMLLVGGATGFIGDPSGRRMDRQVLDDAVLDHNRAGLRTQMEKLLPPMDGMPTPLLVDNRDWINSMNTIEFLRDVGSHFRVNSMLLKDSVKARLDSESGISFTEFSYSLLQARDFEHLFVTHGCELQLGGTDQWGNIVAGLDLMRRRKIGKGHALVWPLLLKTDGEKFGKSADGNVWLDAKKTSVYKFFQFWRNVEDSDVETLLKRFTLVEIDEINDVMDEHCRHPERRLAQQRLAEDVTSWVHGSTATQSVVAASRAVFGVRAAGLLKAEVGLLSAELETVVLPGGELSTADLPSQLVGLGLAESKSDARRAIAAGSIYVDGERVVPGISVTEILSARDWVLVRRGRRKVGLLRTISGEAVVSACE